MPILHMNILKQQTESRLKWLRSNMYDVTVTDALAFQVIDKHTANVITVQKKLADAINEAYALLGNGF